MNAELRTCLYAVEDDNGNTICEAHKRSEVIAAAWAHYDVKHAESHDRLWDGNCYDWDESCILVGFDDDGAETFREDLELSGNTKAEESDFSQHNVWNKAQMGVQ
jgi:hypothetical protein